MTKKPTKPDSNPNLHYDSILGDISNVIDAARKSVARSINCIMTAAYWLIGRRIVESEQKRQGKSPVWRGSFSEAIERFDATVWPWVRYGQSEPDEKVLSALAP